MSAISNEQSVRRDDSNGINNANAVGTSDEDIRGQSDKTLTMEDQGHYTDDPERIEDSKPVDIPPDGGYGWVCVACVFLINGHTWGVNSVSEEALYSFMRANNSISLMESSSLITSRVILFLAQLHSNMHSLAVYRFL